MPLNAYSKEQQVEFELVVASADYASRRAQFKFFDASQGCPSYNDMPWAKAYLGGVKVSEKGKPKLLVGNSKIHVFYFRPSMTPDITAKGGAKEIRRRSAQIVLHGNKAKLTLIKNDAGKPKWVAEGEIALEPATQCGEQSTPEKSDN